MTPRPDYVFDAAVQHERTALAWERTAVALIVAGALMLKHGVDVGAAWAEVLGLLTVTSAAFILLWASNRYESLHRALRSSSDITYPTMIATVAALTSVLSAGAVVLVFLNYI